MPVAVRDECVVGRAFRSGRRRLSESAARRRHHRRRHAVVRLGRSGPNSLELHGRVRAGIGIAVLGRHGPVLIRLCGQNNGQRFTPVEPHIHPAVAAGGGWQLLFSLIPAIDSNVDPDADADIVKLPGSFSDTAFFIGPTLCRVKLVGFDNIGLIGDRLQGTDPQGLSPILITNHSPRMPALRITLPKFSESLRIAA